MTGVTRLARTSILSFLLIGALSPVPAFASGPPWYFYNQCTNGGRYDYQIQVSSTTVPTNGIWWISTVDTIVGDQVYGSTPAGAPGPCGYPVFQGTKDNHPGDLQILMNGVPDGNFAIADNNSVNTTAFDPTSGYGNAAYHFFHIKNGLVHMDGEPYIPATTTEATTTPTGPSSVLFLPGIESSRLYEGNDIALWEPAGALRPTGDLALDSSGESVRQDIYTKDVIDEAYGNGPNIYKTFLETLATLKKDPNGIKDYEAIPYDWRLSLQDNIAYGNKIGDRVYYSGSQRATTSPYLIQELKKLASESKSGKVTIVAHSNGGLLTKELLIEHPELNILVDKIIFVDVPQVGTPEAFGALMHGENQGIPSDLTPFLFTKKQARTLSNNMPMTYNLLPSQGYFAYVEDAIATIDPATLPDWITQYGDSIHSNDRLNAFVDNPTLDKVLPNSSDTIRPTIANSTLLAQAQTLHASLDDWQPASTTQLIQIAGWGVPTVQSIGYQKKLVCVQTGGNCVPQYVLDYNIKDTIDGDGTVVTPSQLWTSGTLPNVKNYFVDLYSYNKGHIDRKHADVLEVADLEQLVVDTLTHNQTLYSYITETVPLSKDTKRLRYSLHSPLSLNLYDSLGNHTGISTSTGQIEEEIPGTYYLEFGDVKYLFTDASSSVHIQMSGYATSTFTFNVDELQGDTLLASTTFKDIPVTPVTQVNLDVGSDISTLSSMHIDLGDGITHAITPKPDGVATLDLTPPEITLAFSTSTNMLAPIATDESGTPTLSTETLYPVLKKNQSGTATTTLTATDSSGNTTVLMYTFKYPTKDRRVAIIPVSVSYNGKVTKFTNTSLKYKWNFSTDSSYKMYASFIQTISTSTESHFLPKKNVTIIMTKPIDLDDTDDDTAADVRATRLKLSGLVIPSLSTKQGKILIGY